eukprot:3510506-Amphidinium_carterae.2
MGPMQPAGRIHREEAGEHEAYTYPHHSNSPDSRTQKRRSKCGPATSISHLQCFLSGVLGV